MLQSWQIKKTNMKIALFNYDEKDFSEKSIELGDCIPCKNLAGVSWLNFDGLPDQATVDKLCQEFGWHQLVQENLLDNTQRPKIEDFGSHCYMVLKMINYDHTKDRFTSEQVNIILGHDYLVTFQEKEFQGDVFDPVRKRIRSGFSRLRKSGPDYLAYRLIDAIVDNYFAVMEKIGDKIEKIEIDAVSHPSRNVLTSVQKLRKEVVFIRKLVWPSREVLNSLQRGESPLISQDTCRYMRDVYDHTAQVIDSVETYRDMLSMMLDIYLSSISNRLNEIMKVLTMISTIFIPLTFIVGLYGMNFHYMPEIYWRYGYLMVWIIILCIVLGMLYFFRRRKWL